GAPHVQLFFEPERHGQAKAAEADRDVGQVGLQEALELGERLVIEDDVVQLPRGQPCLLQAKGHCARRESRVVLLAREPLLLGGGDDLAVDDQGGRAVVIERRNAQDGGQWSHPPSSATVPDTKAGWTKPFPGSCFGKRAARPVTPALPSLLDCTAV